MYKKIGQRTTEKILELPFFFSSERENSVESKEWKIQNRYIHKYVFFNFPCSVFLCSQDTKGDNLKSFFVSLYPVFIHSTLENKLFFASSFFCLYINQQTQINKYEKEITYHYYSCREAYYTIQAMAASGLVTFQKKFYVLVEHQKELHSK